MREWKKETPIKGTVRGCALNPLYDIAPMNMLIAVGFGCAMVTKGDEVVYREPSGFKGDDDFWVTQDAENEALKDPDNDWRITLDAPLYSRVFQRQNVGEWVLIKEGMGFV